MLRERDEGGRGAVIREQRRVIDAPGEPHGAAEAESLDERDHARMELRLVAVRTDEDELRFGIDAAPVVRQHPNEVVLPLVRRDAAHEEKRGPHSLPPREHRVVRRHREVLPVEKNRDARRLLIPGFDERTPIELGDADPELERRRDARELPQAKACERRRVGVDAAEELGWGDVVIHEHTARGDLHELIDDLAAHRKMDEEQIVGLDLAEEPAIRAHVGDAGLRLDRVGERVVAPVPDLLAQREDVVAHRVAGREARVELMDSHFGACPITA